MNRRAFLSFLSVAPVAVPMAAKAMAAESCVVFGIDWAGETDRLGVAYMRKTLSGWQIEHIESRWFTPNEILGFENPSLVNAIAEQHTHVSREPLNLFPTACPDDPGQSAQASQTLNTNSADLLSRSWGSNQGRAFA